MDFLKNKYVYFTFSVVFFLLSILLLIFGKLNLAIDMTGGINMEYSYENDVDIEKIKEEIETLGEQVVFNGNKVINNIGVYSITGEKAFSVVAGFDSSIEEKTLENLKLQFREKILESLKSVDDSTIIETKYVNIGKTFGDYIKNTAILTLAIAAVAITIYLTYAFSGVVSGIRVSSFSMITLITIVHDVMIAAGLYVFVGYFFRDFQIDTFFVTALMTILGYSINNTIVIFDRTRTNLKKYAGKPGKNGKDLYEIVNLSVNDTITRSIFTSTTLLFVLLAIFFFGPEGLSGFILVMIFGTIIGTYSSIFIAPALFFEMNKDKTLTAYKKVRINPEDKIVV